MSLEQCPRRFDLEPKPLFRMITGVGGSSGTRTFRVPVPDPRLWTKVGVIWVPKDAATNLPPGATTLTLWVAAVERGGIADQGTEYPVENLIGTSAAPLTIPTDSALYGKFVQVRTAQTGIAGSLAINTPTAGREGQWFVKASFFPSVDMPREEWDRIVGAIGGIAADDAIGLSV